MYYKLRIFQLYPTRRSSDLGLWMILANPSRGPCVLARGFFGPRRKRYWSTATPVLHLPGSREIRSEEHTSGLQSRGHLVCRLLLEKKKKKRRHAYINST